MSLFFQTIGIVLIAVVLAQVLRRQGKDTAALLGIAVCCMVLAAAGTFLEPIVDFIRKLQGISGLDSDMLGILLKAVGVALVGEIAALVCSDSGDAAMGKTLQILSSCVVLWLSLPLMTALLELVERILGEA